MKRIHVRTLSALGAAAVFALSLSACSSGDTPASGGAESGSATNGDNGGGEPVTLTVYIDSDPSSISLWEKLKTAYEAENENVTLKVDEHPSGGDGDNLVRTRLSTGEMSDLFWYNSGSQFQALDPATNLLPLDDQPWADKLDENAAMSISADGVLYGAPVGVSFAGAMTYNVEIYEELGLSIPKTWDEFMENCKKIKDAGKIAVIQTYGDTWTSQVPVLGDFYNVAAQDPEWADNYTAGKSKFADEPALDGFSNMEEVFKGGYLNENFPSATYNEGVRMLAEGEGAHFPMLTNNVSAEIGESYPEAGDKIGVFPIPSRDASVNGLTVWMPNGIYIPKTTEGAQLDAAKAFIEWLVTPESCALQAEAITVGGPFVIDGCTLPDDSIKLVKDMQPYFDEGNTGLALEFLSPVKGPALEQITVEVGSGISSAKDGAALYDEDVKKQALQLGLEGWD